MPSAEVSFFSSPFLRSLSPAIGCLYFPVITYVFEWFAEKRGLVSFLHLLDLSELIAIIFRQMDLYFLGPVSLCVVFISSF